MLKINRKSDYKIKMVKEKKLQLIVELDGGCGNQLFQIVACKTLAINFKRTPAYSSQKLGKNRNLEVEKVANFFGFERINIDESKKIPKLSEKDLCHPALFSTFPIIPKSKDEKILIYGTFASHRLHKKELIKDLKKFTSSQYNENKLLDNEYISLHLRELLGTFSDIPLDNVDNLNILYFERAFTLIKKNKTFSKIKNVVLFTDLYKNKKNSKLIPKVLKLLKKLDYDVTFGDDIISSPFEVITIMSQAKCIVCSNSTFSWWGAYLSEGQVFCPIYSLWEPALTTPDNWTQIDDGNFNPKTWHGDSKYKFLNVSKLNSRNIKTEFTQYLPNYFLKIINKLTKIFLRVILKKTDGIWNLRFSSLLS